MADVTVQSHVDDLMTSANAAAARTAIGAAPLASPTFTGTPAAPTAAGGTSTTQIASTAFVQQELLSKSYVDGEVATYADLPVTLGTPALDTAYLVRSWSIANPTKFPGMWIRIANGGTLADWKRAGSFADMFADAYFAIYDESDSTKELGFSLGGITAGNKRILTPLDKNYTVEETGHAAKHKSGGSDAIKLDELGAPDDNTTRDATTSLHGLMPKADKVKLDAIEAQADVTDAGNVGSSIHGASAKTTPVDADTVPIIDSEASNVLKKVTWANVKATLKTYFDTVYTTAAAALTAAAGIKLDDFAAPDDNTDLNASTSAHGLALKATAPSAGNRNVHCIDNSETARKDAALFDATNPEAPGTAAPGSAMTAARRDHVHPRQSSITNAELATAAKTFSIQFGKSNNGSALSTGVIDFAPLCPVGATIIGWAISVDTGTATVKFWKKAAGTAIPTIADVINTSGVAISSGTHVKSTTTTDFTTTTITADDLLRCDITAISGATWINVALICTRS